MSNQDITRKTIELIDSLKSTTGAFGLAGTGSEYKIVTEVFLYKFFNDKFGYEAKRNKLYGARLCKEKSSHTIRKRLQLKMGIKNQAFSVFMFEKAYLCCIKIDNSLTNHTFLDKITCVFIQKGVYYISKSM